MSILDFLQILLFVEFFWRQHLDIKPPDGLPILTLESSSRDEAISMPVAPMMSWSAVFESLRIVSFCQNTMAKYVAHLSLHMIFLMHVTVNL